MKGDGTVQHQRGTMVGMTSLTRLLPDTYEDMCCSSLATWDADIDADDEGGAMLPELSKLTSEKTVSASGNIAMISSSVLTTSIIDGLSSGLSWQQLRARVKNFSKHSDVYNPILLSMMECTVPD